MCVLKVNQLRRPVNLIYSNLGDLKQTMLRSGKRYCVTFTDYYSRYITLYYMAFNVDYSRYTKFYLFSHKDETGGMFLKYKAKVENLN